MNEDQITDTFGDEVWDALIEKAQRAYRTAPGGPATKAWAATRVLLSDLRTLLKATRSATAEKAAAEPSPAAEAALSYVEAERSQDGEVRQPPLATLIEQIDGKTRRRAEPVEAQIASNRSREEFIRTVLLVAAIATLLLAVVGIGLVWLGVVPLALVSGAIALLPGAGTALLFRASQSLRSKGERLDAKLDRYDRDLDRMRAIAALDDAEKREEELVAYARELRLQAPPHAV